MLVLKQNNTGFVDLDLVPNVYSARVYSKYEVRCSRDPSSVFWLGTYKTQERANAVLMQLYAAKKAHYNDFVMPMDEMEEEE